MELNFVKRVLAEGGVIKPLIIPAEFTNGTGLCNPSIYIDGDDILCNIRHVQYDLYHSEKDQKYSSWCGPMIYLHPEDDLTLRTENYVCKLNENLDIENFNKVDTSELDITPVWDFIGLEDGRLIRWDNKLYLCGVRRDTKENGEGRMEFSEIQFTNQGIKEVSRHRIQPPIDPNSYCEKNWMPILDRPFEFVKWANPTEVVKADLDTLSSKQTILSTQTINTPRDIRGGSHVIPFEDGYIALTHEVDYWQNENNHKDGIYWHRFIIWDKNFNIKHASKEFRFMDARVEFTCGMAEYKGDYLLSFGYQDNAAYILKVKSSTLKSFIYE